MHYVYLIRSERDGKLYIGQTSDVDLRLQQHNDGKSTYTRLRRPWKLVYFEAFLSKKDALIRELALKDFGRAYGQLKRRLENSFRNS